MGTALAVIGLVSAVFSGVKQHKISKEQKKQNKIQNKIAAIKRSRDTKKQIAASRIQIAQQQAMGFNLGVEGSTSVQGAVSGITGDTATSIGASNLQAVGQGLQAASQDRISGLQGQIGISNAIGSIATSIAGSPQAQAGIEDFFGFGEVA